MKPIKLKNKYIFIIIIVLVAVIGVFSIVNRNLSPAIGGSLKITKDNVVLHSFTLDEIKKLPAVEVYKTIKSGSKPDENGNFKGAELSELLNSVDKSILANSKQILAKADDGFISAFSLDEIKKQGNVLVVYEKDNKPLADKKDGGAGPLRIIVTDDTFGNRCTMYLSEIEVK